jgi:hypothetical protein
MYHGDVRLGDTIDIKFCTVQATGAPTTLSGSPVISAYVGNGTTEITAGITLTVDFDARTGLNNVRVVASSGNGFATATNVQLVITTGTVNSVSAVGYVVGTFSIEARSALMPTVAAKTLDVSATGEAGVDWANVGSPTTSLALTGTTIAVTQKVDVDTIKTNPVVNGGTITFPTTATLASTTNITAGTVTTATNVTTVNGLAAGVITATSIAADAITDAKVAADVTIASVTGAVGSVTGAVGSVTGAVGSVTGAVGSVTGAVGSVTAGVTLANGAITAAKFGASAIDAASLATDAVNEIADGLLDRDMSTGTDSGSTSVRTVRQALRANRNKVSIAAGTLTVTKEDDTTASWTAAVTTTAGNPISAIDPA